MEIRDRADMNRITADVIVDFGKTFTEERKERQNYRHCVPSTYEGLKEDETGTGNLWKALCLRAAHGFWAKFVATDQDPDTHEGALPP